MYTTKGNQKLNINDEKISIKNLYIDNNRLVAGADSFDFSKFIQS